VIETTRNWGQKLAAGRSVPPLVAVPLAATGRNHVDLMRRAGGRSACNPHAVSGEEVAARVRGRYAGKRNDVTGSTRGKRITPSSYV